MKILVIEDEPDLLETLEKFLTKEGFVCETAASFRSAEQKIDLYEYAAIILDLSLPDGDGLDLLNVLKQRRLETGVLIVSAKNALEDKIAGLNLGADDYLTKPFHLAELNARIRALLRRRFFKAGNKIRIQHLEIDPADNVLQVDGQTVALTKKEHDLLLYFIANPDRVLTKSAIAEHLWGDYMDLADNFDLVYTHVKNLRKKIERPGSGACIQTVYGLGYKFTGS